MAMHILNNLVSHSWHSCLSSHHSQFQLSTGNICTYKTFHKNFYGTFKHHFCITYPPTHYDNNYIPFLNSILREIKPQHRKSDIPNYIIKSFKTLETNCGMSGLKLQYVLSDSLGFLSTTHSSAPTFSGGATGWSDEPFKKLLHSIKENLWITPVSRIYGS